jgi:hypothetical protein
MVGEQILMVAFDKIVAGSAYQARNCSCRVLGFPLRPGHYLVLTYLCSFMSMIKRQKDSRRHLLDKISLKHTLTVESDNQHARYILFVFLYHSDFLIFSSSLNSTQGSCFRIIM